MPTNSDSHTETHRSTDDGNAGAGPSDHHGNGGADFSLEDTQQDTGVQTVTVEGLGEARAELLMFGDVEDLQQPGREDVELDAATIARLLKRKYVAPDFSGLTAKKVRTMKPTLPGALLEAIADDDMAVDMNADGSATISADAEADAEGEEAGDATAGN